jgi:TPR repeat protein
VKRFRAIAYLIAGAALGVASPASSRNGDDVRSGIQAWQKGDYRKAVSIWQPLADRGDPDALFNMSQAYRLGRGVRANAATARALLEKAAGQGHLESRTMLGLLLVQNGEQRDAVRWLKSAAQDGEPRALLVFGTALINGDGVSQDRLLGYAYVYRAVAKGLRSAKPTLDSLDALMSAEDRRKALSLYGTAAERKAVSRAAPHDKAAPIATPPVKSVATPAAPTGAWRIQLGAFARPGAAQELFAKLSPSLSGRKAFYLPAGKVTRLLVGPYDNKAAATAACAGFSAKGQPCLVVPPG